MDIKLGNVKVVIINGTGTSGKNTFVDLAKEVYLEQKFNSGPNVKIYDISTINAVKRFATQIFGWDGAKEERDRRMLSDIKDAWTLYSNGPLGDVVGTVVEKSLMNSSAGIDSLFFIHCREPEEIAKLVEVFGTVDSCTTLLIRRPDVSVKGNHADEDVEQYDYQEIIENNSNLAALKLKAKYFLKQIGICEKGGF